MAVLYVLLPDAVAADYDELVLPWLALELAHVGLAGDHLLAVRQFRALLVLEVPEGARQVESAVDSAHVDHSSCVADALDLALVLRLVVDREVDGPSAAAEHTARVARVGHVDVRGGQKDYVGSASSIAGNGVGDVYVAFCVEIDGSLIAGEQLVHLLEGDIQRLRPFLLLVLVQTRKDAFELGGHVLAHFPS